MSTLQLRWNERIPVGALSVLLLWSICISGISLIVVDIVRGLEINLVFLTISLALIFGWFLTHKISDPKSVILSAFMIGSVFLWLRLSLVVPKTAYLIRVITEYLSLIQQSLTAPTPAWTGLSPLLADVTCAALILPTRLWLWIRGISLGKPYFDPLSSSFFWLICLWLCVYWGSWCLRNRKSTLLAFYPSFVLVGSSLSYTRSDPRYLGILICLMLFLAVLNSHRLREYQWTRSRLDYSEDIRVDIAYITTILILNLAFLIFTVPAIRLDKIADAVRDFLTRHDEVSETSGQAIGLSPGSDDGLNPGGGNYSPPQAHIIGEGPKFKQDLIMEISVDADSIGDEISADNTPRFYWKDQVYDRYTGRGWATSSLTDQTVSPGTPIQDFPAEPYWLFRQKIQVFNSPDQTIFAAGEIVQSDRAVTVFWRSGRDLFAGTGQDTQYTITSYVPIFTRQDLIDAGSQVPDELSDRYTALPDTVPNRVYGLARDLTSGTNNRYEQALAIQNYLRSFPYDLDLPTPPAGRDVVDYFLFDLKKGYCDYAASAMVVLARSVGIPVRMVVGYAPGTYDEFRGVYPVRDSDAHAWPEIYFDDYGWVAFEPTASQPAPEDNRAAAQISPRAEAGPTGIRTILGKIPFQWKIAIVLLIFLGMGIIIYRIVYHYSQKSQADRLLRAIHRMAAWSLVPAYPGDTPLELMDRFFSHVGLLEHNPWMENSSQNLAILPIRQYIVETYYASTPPSRATRRSAVNFWNRQSGKIWLKGLQKRVKLIIHPAQPE